VDGNEVEYARIKVDRRYRQYMNRAGGFNQSLAPETENTFGYRGRNKQKKSKHIHHGPQNL